MKRLALTSLLAAQFLACSQPAELEVKDAWSRDTVGGTANAAVFMTISSGTADRLLGASADVARKTDLMTMRNAGGAMGMDYLKSIDVPAGSPVSLNPSGLHVWLADLKRPLRAGESFTLNLKFKNAGDRQVVVSVIKRAGAPPRS